MGQLITRLTAGVLITAFFVPRVWGQAGVMPAQEGAQRPRIGVDIGFGQSDNLGRDSRRVRSDQTTLGVTFDGRTDRRVLDARLFADLDFYDYSAEGVPNQVMGMLDAAVQFQVVPDRFSWDLTHDFGQARPEPLASAGVDNRERTNVLSTGPRLQIPIGERDTFQLEGRVSERRFEESRQFNSRFSALRAGLVHAFDPVTRMEFAVDKNSNEFEATDSEYSFRIVSLSYDKDFASGGMRATVGSGEVDLGSGSEDTLVGRVEWSRDVGTRSRLDVWFGRELTDAGEIFRLSGTQGFANVGLSGFSGVIDLNDDRLRGVVLAASPLERANAGIRLNLTGEKISIGLSLNRSEDDFEADDTYDNDLNSFQVSVSRALGSRWRAEAAAGVARQAFVALAEENDDLFGRLTLFRQFARNLVMSIQGERLSRGSGFAQFDENVYRVSFGYAFGQ